MKKNRKGGVKKIVITGAESTGKTRLAKDLAIHYGSVWIPEFARGYIESINRPYTYNDVESIAKEQIVLEEKIEVKATDFVFFDTWLIITKIWFDEVYNKVPLWLDKHIAKSKIDLFLVCENDIEWKPDPVRENRNKRAYLQSRYIGEIEKTGSPWKLITGIGVERLNNAIISIDQFFGY